LVWFFTVLGIEPGPHTYRASTLPLKLCPQHCFYSYFYLRIYLR
jgi:hypothetical protein